MKSIKELTRRIVEFRNARDWKQFHNPKDVALSLVLEAGEVVEHFQWKSQGEIKRYLETNKEAIGEELADVLYWVLLMSHDLDIDITHSLEEKIKKNEVKYPLEKAKGSSRKHNQL